MERTISDEEKRIKLRLIDMGLRQTDVARIIGIARADVCAVVRGVSRSPRYAEEVYKFLGLQMPHDSGKADE